MRKFLLLTPLLLAGCIKQSASYYVNDARVHAISVRAEQEYFWDQHITLSFVASHLPACQRAFPLEKVLRDDVAVELFSPGENVFTIRSGEELVQFEVQECTRLATPAPNALGQAVGVFRLGDGQKMLFEPAAPQPGAAPQAPAGSAATAPAAQPVETPAATPPE